MGLEKENQEKKESEPYEIQCAEMTLKANHEVEIEFAETGADSNVRIDGEPIHGAYEVTVHTKVGGLTTAIISVHPQKVKFDGNDLYIKAGDRVYRFVEESTHAKILERCEEWD